MKNKLNILVVVFALFTFSVNAQVIKKIKKRVHPISSNTTNSNTTFEGCNIVLASKDGVVYSVNPGYLNTVAKANKVTVIIYKSGGRAKTTVNIYAGSQLKKRIIFENGNYKKTEQRVLNNVRGKKIKVEIVNQSVGNTFKYTAKIIGKDASLTPNRTPVKGVLAGQFEKRITINKSCTGKTKIVITNTSGRAQAAVKITYSKNNRSKQKETIFTGHPKTKEFIINSDKSINIYMKNMSVLDRFGYKIKAYAIQ